MSATHAPHHHYRARDVGWTRAAACLLAVPSVATDINSVWLSS
jgi:hypothetical protein